MKHLIQTTLLLLAVLLPALATAHDFEVDGIYYNITGSNTVSVTFLGDFCSEFNEYSGEVTIPATVIYGSTSYSVTAIGDGAFEGCSGLTSVILSNSLERIGDGAFYRCSGLTSVTIPNSVTEIGESAFSGCSGLTEITIPSSIIYIGWYAFSGCTALNTLNYNAISCYYISYDAEDPSTHPFDNLNISTVNIGDSVQIIPANFILGLKNVTSITIPNSVTEIGDCAFYECSGLTSITIPNSVTAIGNFAFSFCSGLTSITIPNSVTEIGEFAFECCSGLTEITIPSSVNHIDRDAFWGCTALTTLNYNAISADFECHFGDCESPFYESNLSTVNIGDSVQRIPAYFVYGINTLKSINFNNSVIEIGYAAFWDTSWYEDQPDGVVYAGLVAYNFKGDMPNNTSIVLKDGTLGIGDYAFGSGEEKKSDINTNRGYPWDLVNIEIPNSVIHIGDGAFANSRLKKIEIPKSVTYIGYNAFYGTNLSNIEIGESVRIIDEGAFNGCNPNNIYCYASTPPTCIRSFSNYSATLHVPAASLAAYFTAPVWSNFENIVGDAVAPTGISISKDCKEIQLGGQFELTATVTPANASIKDVSWYSTDETVATIENGMVTTVGVGECDIIAIRIGMRDTCHVSVFNKISMEQEEAMLLPNHMLTLTPTAPVMPVGFTVTSSEPTVAAARLMNGKVQVVGIKEGTTTITVGSADGTAVPATCLVTVYTESGDTNMDGFVNISDVTDMIDYLLDSDVTNFKAANADLDGDGKVTISDVTALIDILLTSDN